MYVLLFIAGISLWAIALFTLGVAGFLALERGEGRGSWGWSRVFLVALLAVAAAVGGTLTIRQASWTYAGVECAGISDANPSLDVNRVQVTFWDFGCYVTLDDDVTIPWSRYRAVVEG